MRCDPLTIRDGFSRYVLALQLLTQTRTDAARQCAHVARAILVELKRTGYRDRFDFVTR